MESLTGTIQIFPYDVEAVTLGLKRHPGYKVEFNNREELRFEILDWARALFYQVYEPNKYRYKRAKAYRFKIDADYYSIFFTAITERDKELRAIYKLNSKHKKKFSEALQYSAIPTQLEYDAKLAESLQKQVDRIVDNYISKANDTIQYQLSTDVFDSTKRFLSDSITQTLFQDNTAIEICEKVQSPFIRTLLKDKTGNIIELHKVAMKCFEKYGGAVINFLLSLPKLSFGSRTSHSLINKENFKGEIPSLKILIKERNLEFYICFFSKKLTQNNLSHIASIYNKNSKKVEGFLTIKGYIEYRISKEPTNINLFIDTLTDEKQISCSVESGYCINCNRELSDLNSLRVGYGRKCAEHLGVPYESYHNQQEEN